MSDVTAYCEPDHRRGSRPYVVPVAGNNAREVPLFLAYHGQEYLDADGRVTRHPVRMTIHDTKAAIQAHEASVRWRAVLNYGTSGSQPGLVTVSCAVCERPFVSEGQPSIGYYRCTGSDQQQISSHDLDYTPGVMREELDGWGLLVLMPAYCQPGEPHNPQGCDCGELGS